MKVWFAITVAALVLAAAATARATDVGCKGTDNTFPIWSGESKQIKSVDNGRLYVTGPAGNEIRVMHLYGDAYTAGVAHGQLMKDVMTTMYPQFFQWIEGQIDPYIKFLPKFMREAIETGGVRAALALTADLTKKYTPQRFIDEMKGIADGSGLPYDEILGLQMFPEVIKAQCSIVGAWGEATVNSTNGGLLQLRALDWGIDNPLVNYPTLIVYHPQKKQNEDADPGHEFSILAFPGFIGALTGFSSQLGISEKVWLHYDGKSSRVGMPWHFLLRDILQFDVTLDDATNRMVNNRRTCSIFVGVGSHHDQELRVFEYAHESLNEFDDVNYPLYKEHERMNGLVYVDKHTQPDHNVCFENLLHDNYGSITAETIIRHAVSQMQTGDLHAAVYDFSNNDMYIGLAGGAVPGVMDAKAGEVLPAYARPWLKIDMNDEFSRAQ